MSAQRARSAVAANHRSAHPSIPGIPWWGAVLLAVTATAVGFAISAGSGDKELGFAFALCYAVGCVLAVLAVRQAGLFTAVVQPPLILFVSVPGAYFLFHGGELTGLKDVLINCGYPLIERFPLMLFTTAAVLLIGLGRWYYAISKGHSPASATGRADKPPTKSAAKTAAGAGLLATVTASLASLARRGAAQVRGKDDAEPARAPRRRHAATDARSGRRTADARSDRKTADARSDRKTADARSDRRTADARSERRTDRPTRAARTPEHGRAARKPAERTASTRSRHTRASGADFVEPGAERPRRPRPARAADPTPAEPRRRTRSQSAREPGKQPPADRYSGYPRTERTERRRLDDYEPQRRAANGSTGSGSTHHPISRVRYRGEEGDSGSELRTRQPRPQRAWDADAWEYDV